MSGLSSVLDALTWTLCDDGEGILVPRPLYLGFNFDIPCRARGIMVPVEYASLEGYTGFASLFDEKLNVTAMEAALKGAREKGIKVKAVLLAQ